jgi:hypothetical protein
VVDWARALADGGVLRWRRRQRRHPLRPARGVQRPRGRNAHEVDLAVAHYLGLAQRTTGDLDEAVGWLEPAITKHRDMRAPFHTAWSKIALAQALLERDADAVLAQLARADIDRSGRAGFEARSLQRRNGARPRHSSSGDQVRRA